VAVSTFFVATFTLALASAIALAYLVGAASVSVVLLIYAWEFVFDTSVGRDSLEATDEVATTATGFFSFFFLSSSSSELELDDKEEDLFSLSFFFVDFYYLSVNVDYDFWDEEFYDSVVFSIYALTI